MSLTDPIANYLTLLRNALQARRQKVDIPSSNLLVEMTKLLKEEGYINNYKVTAEGSKTILRVYLKYIDEKDSVINEIKRVSKPGGRVYVKSEDIPLVKSGLGIAILSTSKGIITDNAARKSGVGGELICTVW